jgi:hypothetical protein
MEVSGHLNALADLPPGQEFPVPIGYRAGWAPDSVWTLWRTAGYWQGFWKMISDISRHGRHIKIFFNSEGKYLQGDHNNYRLVTIYLYIYIYIYLYIYIYAQKHNTHKIYIPHGTHSKCEVWLWTAPCSLVTVHECFRRTDCLHLQSLRLSWVSNTVASCLLSLHFDPDNPLKHQ